MKGIDTRTLRTVIDVGPNWMTVYVHFDRTVGGHKAEYSIAFGPGWPWLSLLYQGRRLQWSSMPERTAVRKVLRLVRHLRRALKEQPYRPDGRP
jgi:hypothetical protein